MARAADFDLAKELAKPSFTPAQRDAPALVELVIADHDKAAAALAGLGDAGRRAIEARLAPADETTGAPPAPTDARLAPADETTGAPPAPTDARLAPADDTTGARPAPPEARLAPADDTTGARPAPTDARLAPVDDGGRARLVGALGLLARAGDAAARAELLARVRDPAARVRRAAETALGKLGDDADARTALLARLDGGDAPPDELRTLVEALGKLGGEAVLARLRALDPKGDAELARRRDRALLMIERDAGRAETSSIDASVALPFTVRLHCKAGLGVLLAEEVARTGRVEASTDAWVETRVARWDALWQSRMWATAGLRVPLRPATRGGERGGERSRERGGERSGERGGEIDARAIVDAITSPDVRGLLRAMTRGPIRWRLGFPSGHRRALVWQIARDVAARAPELVNDPRESVWDIVVDDAGGRDGAALELTPRRADDPRFAWRVAEVPAASHPTVAAALAFVAGARAGERVWDPFCGSGAELVERARLGPCTLLGTDLDETALAAARANLAAANVDGKLALADARTASEQLATLLPSAAAQAQVDLVITNPPLGSRVQVDATGLLVAALPGFARALAPGGRLVWITPASKHTTPAAERAGLVRTRELAIDLGGVRGRLERWERRGR